MSNNTIFRLICADCTDADIRYGSGFNAADEFTYFEAGGQRCTVVSTLEYSRAVTECHANVKVLEWPAILRKLPEDVAKGNRLVALSRFCGASRWEVPCRFPAGYAEELRNAGIEVHVVKGDFFPERAVKTADEIKHIRAAMRATEDAMMYVRDRIAEASVDAEGFLRKPDGSLLTSEFLRAEVEAEFKRRSFTASQTIIAGGSQAAAPHNIGTGPLRAGEAVVCDIFPRSDVTGYWGDMTRTFCKGTPLPVVARAFEAVKMASEASLAAVRAGVTGASVHELAAKLLTDAGFPVRRNPKGEPCGFFHGLGHGLGLEIHEQPRLSPVNTCPLEPGAVVSVEPGLYDPEWGGIRLEDLVLVTPGGCENFCTMEKDLIV